jgi:hypothetical protein
MTQERYAVDTKRVSVSAIIFVSDIGIGSTFTKFP